MAATLTARAQDQFCRARYGGRVSAEQFQLHTKTVGDSGPTVVFLHGLFGQGRNFATIARTLQPDLRSVLVDLPDHGRSGRTEEFGYERYADAVAAHVEGSDAAPVHVVGHSLGGKVAMVLALRRPDLVDRLVVVDIAPASSDETGQFDHYLDALTGLDLDALTGRGQADEQLARHVEDPVVRGFLLQNLSTADGVWRWQANLDLLRRSLPTIGGFPDLGGATFDHPVLWVAGEHSTYIRPEHREAMRALFPRTYLVTVKGAGHWVHSEQPERFIATLRRFLLGPA